MIRAALAGGAMLVLAGCAGVPAAVIWSTAGAGLGFGAAALKFDDDLLNYEIKKDAPPVAP